MSPTDGVIQRDLEEKRRRLARPSKWFWLAALALMAPGIVLAIVGDGWVFVLGWVLIALGALPLIVAVSLTGAAGVGWWAARGKPFA